MAGLTSMRSVASAIARCPLTRCDEFPADWYLLVQGMFQLKTFDGVADRKSMRRVALVCGLILWLAGPGRPDDNQAAALPPKDLSALTLEQLMEIKVEGAARHEQ